MQCAAPILQSKLDGYIGHPPQSPTSWKVMLLGDCYVGQLEAARPLDALWSLLEEWGSKSQPPMGDDIPVLP